MPAQTEMLSGGDPWARTSRSSARSETKESHLGSSYGGSVKPNPNSIHEEAGPIPGLAQ